MRETQRTEVTFADGMALIADSKENLQYNHNIRGRIAEDKHEN